MIVDRGTRLAFDLPEAGPSAELEPGWDERELLERCRAGRDGPEHAAFRALYERRSGEVLRFLRRLLGDAASAEDATQETFVRLYRSLAKVDPARPLRPFVLRIARNVAIDVLRARKAKPTEALDDRDGRESAPSALEGAARGERREAVRAALDALPPEHRSVLVLRFVHGLKLDDVAQSLDCTERTCRNRLRAAAVLLERELRRRGVLADLEEGGAS